jgi:hypothetical protein
VTGVKKACELTGKSRATVYRRRNGIRSGCRERRPAPPNALSAGERDELLAVLDSRRFQDKAPRQVWALLIDEGTYLASVSTMYRLLREAEQVRERRAQAAHPARTKPELIADAPNEVWSWDITKLAGPLRGVYYHLYVMIDIFSRCAVHFEVHATELGELAKDFMTEAVRLNSGIAPHAICSATRWLGILASRWAGMTGDGKGPAGGAGGAWWCPGWRGGGVVAGYPFARVMAVVIRAMLVRSRLPRTRARWTGMWLSPRLAAMRKTAASEGEQLSWRVSRAVMASSQSM